MKYIHSVHPPGHQNININIFLHKVGAVCRASGTVHSAL